MDKIPTVSHWLRRSSELIAIIGGPKRSATLSIEMFAFDSSAHGVTARHSSIKHPERPSDAPYAPRIIGHHGQFLLPYDFPALTCPTGPASPLATDSPSDRPAHAMHWPVFETAHDVEATWFKLASASLAVLGASAFKDQIFSAFVFNAVSLPSILLSFDTRPDWSSECM